MGFIRVARLEEIGDGGLLAVRLEGRTLCLARIGDEVYAFTDNCSHRDYPLSSGELDAEDCTITCDWHGARFDVRSGAALSLPATRPISVHECRVEGEAVFVDPS